MNRLWNEIKQVFGKNGGPVSIMDNIKPKGKPFITIRNNHGNIVQTIEKDNIVVRDGRHMMAKALCGLGTFKKVTHIQLGKGGVPVDKPFEPYTPNIEDNALYVPINGTKKVIISLTQPATDRPMECTFSITYTASEIDEIVSEAILILEDGKVFAHHTFPGTYMKIDRGYTMEINWVVKFA